MPGNKYGLKVPRTHASGIGAVPANPIGEELLKRKAAPAFLFLVLGDCCSYSRAALMLVVGSYPFYLNAFRR